MRWVDISVGKKLYATFCAFIFFFLITMGAMLLYLDIVNKDAKILSQPSKDGALLAAVCAVSWPVFAAGFGRGRVNCFTLVSIGAAVTLLDTLTFLLQAGRLPRYKKYLAKKAGRPASAGHRA